MLQPTFNAIFDPDQSDYDPISNLMDYCIALEDYIVQENLKDNPDELGLLEASAQHRETLEYLAEYGFGRS